MLDALLKLPLLPGCLVFMATMIVAGLATYVVSHRTLFMGKREDLVHATRTIFLAINLLVGLFLSLTLNELEKELNDIDDAVALEAGAISDIYKLLSYFDSVVASDAQRLLIDYTEAVIEHDWPSLAEDRLSEQAEVLRREVVSSIQSLHADNPVERSAWDHIANDMDSMSDYRIARLNHALAPAPFFILVVIVGIIFVHATLIAYKAGPDHLGPTDQVDRAGKAMVWPPTTAVQWPRVLCKSSCGLRYQAISKERVHFINFRCKTRDTFECRLTGQITFPNSSRNSTIW